MITSNKIDVARDPKQLRWKFRVGQSLRYNVKISRFRADGSSGDETYVLLCNVVSLLPGGGAELEGTYESIRILERDDVEFSFDSNQSIGEATPLSHLLEALTGRQFQFHLDAQGRVSAVCGMERIWWSLLSKVSPHLRNVESLQSLRLLSNAFSNTALKSLLVAAFPALPEYAVAQGDSWKQEGPEGSFLTSVPLMEPNFTRLTMVDKCADGSASLESTLAFDPARGAVLSRRDKLTQRESQDEAEAVEVVEAELLHMAERTRVPTSDATAIRMRQALAIAQEW